MSEKQTKITNGAKPLLNIRLGEKLKEELAEEARNQDRSMAYLAKKYIRSGLRRDKGIHADY